MFCYANCLVPECNSSILQVEEARNKVSETSTKMYNSVLDSHEKSKELDKTFKDLTKEVQSLNKEKDAIEQQRTEAIKKHAQLELDVKDLQEKISGNVRAKVLLMYISVEKAFCFGNCKGGEEKFVMIFFSCFRKMR